MPAIGAGAHTLLASPASPWPHVQTVSLAIAWDVVSAPTNKIATKVVRMAAEIFRSVMVEEVTCQ